MPAHIATALSAWFSVFAAPMLLLSTTLIENIQQGIRTKPMQKLLEFPEDFTLLVSGIHVALIPAIVLFLISRYWRIPMSPRAMLLASCFGAICAHMSIRFGSNLSTISPAQVFAAVFGQSSSAQCY